MAQQEAVPAPADGLCAVATGPTSLESRVKSLEEENDRLRQIIADSVPPSFSIAQYNLLAGYLGNNMEPWFLYGADATEEVQNEVKKRHRQKDADGKYMYQGWPSYAKGVLTDEQIRKVEEVHKSSFEWEGQDGKPGRRERLKDTAMKLNADIMSFVECDHYEDVPPAKTCHGHDCAPGYWKDAMLKEGYDSHWMKRPRNGSHDGCGLFWRQSKFELIAKGGEVLIDGMRQGREMKDRICIAVLLRMRCWPKQRLLVVSTHLARNPEESSQEWLRARQIAQMMQFLERFSRENNAENAPVVIAGDMNSSNFCRVRGLAEAMMIICAKYTKEQPKIHEMLFEARDVPTDATSITTCRAVRIDALLYQRRALQLKEIERIPAPDHPIPCPIHPSDHTPIKATFRVPHEAESRGFSATSFVNTILGIGSPAPLTRTQLEEAFLFFDWNGTGVLDTEDMVRALAELETMRLRAKELDEIKGILEASTGGKKSMGPEEFMQVYQQHLKERLHQRSELQWAFSMMDTNKDEKLDFKEILACMKAASPIHVEEAVLRAAFDAADEDRDGQIDIGEFTKHMAANYGKLTRGEGSVLSKHAIQDTYDWAKRDSTA